VGLGFTLKDIFDVELLERMLNDLYKLVKAPLAIVDISGEVIVQVGCTSICTEFYRKDQISFKQCMEVGIEDDLDISSSHKVLECHNGLKMYKAAIVIKGTVVANVILSQFLLEAPIEEKIVFEAKKYGFPLEIFKTVHYKAQIITYKQLEQLVLFIDRFVAVLNDIIEKRFTYKELEEELLSGYDVLGSAYQQLSTLDDDLKINISKLKEKDNELINSEMRYFKLFSHMSQGLVVFKVINNFEKATDEYCVVDVNNAFETLTNINREQLIGKTLTDIRNQFDFSLINNIRDLINNDSKKPFEYFSKKLNKCFDILAYQFSQDEVVILISDITREYDEAILQKKQLMDTVIAMGSMIEKRDLYTAGHQKKVAYLACKIALEIGLAKDRIEGLYIASRLHDIGKIGIPSEILTKPDKLSTAEFEIIKSHPQIACDILSKIEFTWPIATIVLQHHEKLNGTGYPNGLSGEEILLEAKILLVADVVEAITAHRPYRPSLGLPNALEEISNFSGIYYEADIVDACIRVCSKNDWSKMMEEALDDSNSSLLKV